MLFLLWPDDDLRTEPRDAQAARSLRAGFWTLFLLVLLLGVLLVSASGAQTPDGCTAVRDGLLPPDRACVTALERANGPVLESLPRVPAEIDVADPQDRAARFWAVHEWVQRAFASRYLLTRDGRADAERVARLHEVAARLALRLPLDAAQETAAADLGALCRCRLRATGLEGR